MSRLVRGIALCVFVTGIGVSSAAAQTAAPPVASPPQSSTAATQDDDDRQLKLAEPDFSVVNGATTMVLPKHEMSFRLTHRFLGNLQQGSFSENLGNLFGLDNGAIIGLEFRYAPIRHVQAIFYRNNLSKTIQFTGQYDALRQRGSMPVSISGIVSIEGTNNFRSGDSHDDGEAGEHDHGTSIGHKSPALGAVVSRLVGNRLALYASPVWVHHVVQLEEGPRDTFYLGVGGRYRLSRRAYVVGEVFPRVNGYAPGNPAFAFGIETRAGGHMFQLNFGNSVASTFGQIAQGGFPDTIYMGFNLGRKFF